MQQNVGPEPLGDPPNHPAATTQPYRTQGPLQPPDPLRSEAARSPTHIPCLGRGRGWTRLEASKASPPHFSLFFLPPHGGSCCILGRGSQLDPGHPGPSEQGWEQSRSSPGPAIPLAGFADE